MSSPVKLSTRDDWALLFTVACGILTVRAVARGHDRIQILLLGMLTAYALSITLNRLPQIPHLTHLAAIPLGVVGVVAYLVGTPTDLPFFFILLGIGSLVDLLWDPSGNVYENNSG